MTSSAESKFNPKSLWQVGNYVLVVVLSVVLTLAILRLFPRFILTSLPSAPVGTPTQITQIPASKTISPHNFVVAAANRVGPAVIRVDTERTVATNIPNSFSNDPFFRNFFGDDFFPSLPREYRQRGQGSGFIVDSSGIILTNAHVVSGADQVSITLSDGRTFEGEVKGTDTLSDLAVIKIQGENLPVAPLGDSDQLQVGDWAIAVGNPLGLDNTVTLGIISTLNRSSAQVGIVDSRLDFIQTDTAINPGNSGGPLLNEKGEVIGINTAIRAEAEGIGFAIPINNAKAVQDILAQGKTVSHPFIGIHMITLTSDIAKRLNNDPNTPFVVPDVEGALIAQVVPNSPAAKGGLRSGDVILDINGTMITNADQLQDLVEDSEIGEALRVEIRRGEQHQTLTIRPMEIQEFAQ